MVSLSEVLKTTGQQRPLVLASSSPRRRMLLTNLGLRFTIRISDLDEAMTAPDEPVGFVTSLARQKAEIVAWETLPETNDNPSNSSVDDRQQSPLVLAADTIVALDGEILGKPVDNDAARAMLLRLRDRAHEVLTAVALVDTAARQGDVHVVRTGVTMRPFSDGDLQEYIDTGEPLDKAGGYGIQRGTRKLIAGFDGCFTNVVGLPVCEVVAMLTARGIAIPTSSPYCRLPDGTVCPREVRLVRDGILPAPDGTGS